MNPVRIAVIGAGQFGRNHLRVVSALPGVTLAAVIDSDCDCARTTALAVTAGLTLLLDRDEILKRANAAKITIIGYTPRNPAAPREDE